MSSALQGSALVPAGGTTLTVMGNFGIISQGTLQYTVNAQPEGLWQTTVAITDKEASFFSLEFASPAPPGGGTVAWWVTGGSTNLSGAFQDLGDYLADVRRLLRDESTQGAPLYSDTDLTAFINRAMQQRDLDLGLNRTRVSLPMTTSQFAYDINTILSQGTILTGTGLPTASLTIVLNSAGITATTVTGPFTPNFEVLRATPSWLTTISVTNITSTSFQLNFDTPTPAPGAFVDVTMAGVGVNARINVIDVLSIVITPLGQPPGGIRYPLGRWPYSRLAYLLSTSYPTYPVKYALYGVQTIMVAPPPANPYPTEWDFFGYASPMVNETDADPMPYPWTDPIPFWACHFAKLAVQRFDEAKGFKEEAMDRTRRVMARGRPIAVANPWQDLPRNAR